MLLQIPGGPELVIIFLVLALLVGVPVVLAGVFLLVRYGSGDDDSAEVAELKGRIDELEAQVAAGSEAAHNEVTVPDERGEEGSASSGADSEASGAERPAGSGDGADGNG